jgi:hypothetical protein
MDNFYHPVARPTYRGGELQQRSVLHMNTDELSWQP